MPAIRPWLLLALASLAAVADAQSSAPAIVDHHVHVLGPGVIRDWKSLGVTFSRPDAVYLSPASLFEGRGDSIGGVVLVPMAHLYANPEFVEALGIDAAEARRRVRAENAHVAREAARFSGRAVALCSVPALADWAIDDLQWCRDSLRVAGIKLHLASSQVDLRDATHLDRLTAIARFAERANLPVLVHVDPQRRGHDTTHIRAFAERVLQPHPRLQVVIAHLGGSGGYGPWTRSVFRTLRAWRRDVERTGPRRGVYFELSAVVLEAESEGVPAITDAEVRMLRDDLRAEGFDRVLFGSDYPVFDPRRGRQALIERLGLTPAEVDGIVAARIRGMFDR
jgi:predicted TIM-barrel fold metal-dependent hydrolase